MMRKMQLSVMLTLALCLLLVTYASALTSRYPPPHLSSRKLLRLGQAAANLGAIRHLFLSEAETDAEFRSWPPTGPWGTPPYVPRGLSDAEGPWSTGYIHIHINHLANSTMNYLKSAVNLASEYPKTSLFIGGAIAGPVLIGPTLGAVGFTSAGVAAKSLAASWMSYTAVGSGGGVAAGSFFAQCQSAGVLGVSVTTSATVAAVSGTASAAAKDVYDRWWQPKEST